MHAALRALPFVLGISWANGVPAVEAAEALPGIFETEHVRPRELLSREPARAPLPLSDKVRQAFAERVVATGRSYEAVKPAAWLALPHGAAGETVTMDPYVVKAPAPRKVEPARVRPPLLQAIVTGTVYSWDRDGAKTLNVRALPVTENGAGFPTEFTRYEIFLRLKL